jgi:hypothetical protein
VRQNARISELREQGVLTRLFDFAGGMLTGSGTVMLIGSGMSFSEIGFYYRVGMFVAAISLFIVGLFVMVSQIRTSSPSSIAKSVPSVGRADADAERYAGLLSKLEQLRREKNLPADVHSKLREEYVMELKKHFRSFKHKLGEP